MSKFLVLSCETSGLNKADSLNPAGSGSTYYQPLTWGMVVVDDKFNIIDELYTEICWDAKSKWDDEAAIHHGLTIEYLAANGFTEREAMEDIGSFIFEHFETKPITVIGYNPLFAVSFLKAMFARYELPFTFSSKMLDLNTVGTLLLDTKNRDELFDALGIKVGKRNALITSRNMVKSFKTIKTLLSSLL